MTRELTIVYGSVTIGGSTARQIDKYTIESDSYETAAVEVEFVTTAATEAAFATELSTLRTAFRTPRQNLSITLGAATLLSLSQSANTGFDAAPEILKDGDPADTGRSRHFRIRIEFGRPADVVNTDFRRWSTVNVSYDAARRLTVTISGTYTANSTNGTTNSFDQYRAQIDAYATTVLNDIDDANDFERVGEPSVEYGETNKVCNFVAVYKEIIFNQRLGTLNDADIVDPVLTVVRNRMAPGDSIAGAPLISGAGRQTTSPGVNSGQNGTVTTLPGGSGTTTGAAMGRPTLITLNYSCSINKENTTNLTQKWSGVIRPFLISTAKTIAGGGKIVLVDEKPQFGDLYGNLLSASMSFINYSQTILEQKITVADTTNYGKVLVGVWTSDPLDYYRFPGPVVRVRTYTEERKEIVGTADPNNIVDPLVAPPGSTVSGLRESDRWELMSRTPHAPVIKQGLDGAETVLIAETKVETVLQYRKLKPPSVANAGGVTGAVFTT